MFIERVWYMKDLFKALSDETRREILEMLKNNKMTASEISSQFNMSQASVSQHLKILRLNDLIYSERQEK